MTLKQMLGRLGLPREAQQAPSASPRIVIFGDSHAHAIQQAIKARRRAGIAVTIEIHRVLKDKSGGEQRDHVVAVSAGSLRDRLFGRRSTQVAGAIGAGKPTALKTLGDISQADFLAVARSLRSSDILVSAIGGNQHATFSTIQHDEPFDFFFPEDRPVATENNAPIIPFQILYESFSTKLRRSEGTTIAALRSATRAQMAHLLAPPPKRDTDFIQKHHDSFFAAQGIASRGVSSPQLRMKFWRMQNRVLEELCAELSIETIAPPAAACAAGGFLDPSCYARDATHANATYGELVLRQLEQCYPQLVSS